MQADGLATWLRAAAHALELPPVAAPWNLAELEGCVDVAAMRAAAVLVGVVPRPAGASVLLTRRTDDLRHHAGQVSFPGGRIEPEDPSPAAAAVREAVEEVGLVPAQVQPLGYLDPLATITGFRVQPVLALVAPDYVPSPAPGEVADIFEVPLSLLLDPAQPEQTVIQFGGKTRCVFQYRYTPQRIWGATASILFNLRQRLATANHGRV